MIAGESSRSLEGVQRTILFSWRPVFTGILLAQRSSSEQNRNSSPYAAYLLCMFLFEWVVEALSFLTVLIVHDLLITVPASPHSCDRNFSTLFLLIYRNWKTRSCLLSSILLQLGKAYAANIGIKILQWFRKHCGQYLLFLWYCFYY